MWAWINKKNYIYYVLDIDRAHRDHEQKEFNGKAINKNNRKLNVDK